MFMLGDQTKCIFKASLWELVIVISSFFWPKDSDYLTGKIISRLIDIGKYNDLLALCSNYPKATTTQKEITEKEETKGGGIGQGAAEDAAGSAGTRPVGQ